LTTHKQPTHRQQHTKRRTRKISYFIYRENHGKLKELPRFIHVSKKLLPYKRCSRSLCSSQTTTPPHTNPPKAPNNPSHKEEPPDTAWQAVMRRKPGNKQLTLLFQDPTVCQTHNNQTPNNPQRSVPTRPRRGRGTKTRQPGADHRLFC